MLRRDRLIDAGQPVAFAMGGFAVFYLRLGPTHNFSVLKTDCKIFY